MTSRKISIILLGGFFTLLLVFSIFASFRAETVRVNVTVLPPDGTLTIDGKEKKAGNIRVTPGKHTFKATRSGFKDTSQTVTVTDKTKTITLLPEPASPAAFQYLTKNPDIQREREAASGEALAAESEAAVKATPLIKQLPYTEINGPFSIDYGPSVLHPNGTVIVISDSSPEGRINALKWIKKQGYDPAKLEIQFIDFQNPIIPNISQEASE